MIDVNLKPKHQEEYKRLEDDLVYKVGIDVLTISEAGEIVDIWLQEHGY